MFKQLFLPFIAVAAFVVFVGLLYQGKIGSLENVFINNTKNEKVVLLNDVKVKVEIAKTDEERQKGLSGRTQLDENSGMLFVMPPDSKPSFWMKDTLIPLDIVWIKDGKVVGIEENVSVEEGIESTNLTLYPAPSVVDYVLEVNAGFTQKNNITKGSTFQMQFDL